CRIRLRASASTSAITMTPGSSQGMMLTSPTMSRPGGVVQTTTAMTTSAPQDVRRKRRMRPSMNVRRAYKSCAGRLAGVSPGLAESCWKLVDSLNRLVGTVSLTRGAAEFRGRQPGAGLEGAVERSDRLEPGVQGDGQDRHVALARIRE